VLPALDVTALLPLAAFAIALLLPPDAPGAARGASPEDAASAAIDEPGEPAAIAGARNRTQERARTSMGGDRSDAAGGQ
jgi:hypothetical protein